MTGYPQPRIYHPKTQNRQTRYDQPLWVRVQGAYANVEAARTARDNFPTGFQKRKDLWIRKFGMIQRLIE